MSNALTRPDVKSLILDLGKGWVHRERLNKLIQISATSPRGTTIMPSDRSAIAPGYPSAIRSLGWSGIFAPTLYSYANENRYRTSVIALCVPVGWTAESPLRRATDASTSPPGRCTEAVVGALGKAKSTVLVQASYAFAQIRKADSCSELKREGPGPLTAWTFHEARAAAVCADGGGSQSSLGASPP